MTTTRSRAWALFDRIVDTAPLRGSNPWQREDDGGFRFEPDYETLGRLLGVRHCSRRTASRAFPRWPSTCGWPTS